MRAYCLFPQKPTLYFYPDEHQCNYCASELLIHKTIRKTVATLNIGEFQAVEIQKKCNAILKSVKQVFPDIADFICHFHFLRDLGKDLFDFEYRTIRRYTRSYNVQAKLKKISKQLKQIIDDDQQLSDSLKWYLSHQTIQCT